LGRIPNELKLADLGYRYLVVENHLIFYVWIEPEKVAELHRNSIWITKGNGFGPILMYVQFVQKLTQSNHFRMRRTELGLDLQDGRLLVPFQG